MPRATARTIRWRQERELGARAGGGVGLVGEAETPGGGGVCLPLFAHAFGQKAKVALLSTRPSGEGDIFATLDRLSIERSSGACPPSRRSYVVASLAPALIICLGDYDFPKKKKKNTRKGLAMRLSSGIARWWRSPGAAHAVSREGGEGEERAPRARRTAAGGRPGRTALRNVPPGSCAESFSRGGGASNAGRPPPSSALNTGLHMK